MWSGYVACNGVIGQFFSRSRKRQIIVQRKVVAGIVFLRPNRPRLKNMKAPKGPKGCGPKKLTKQPN
jgi:hypothetical protein